jgi:integrase
VGAQPPRTPSYRLHKPSGQAVVTLNRRDIYLGRYGTEESRAEYDRVVAEWLTSGRRLESKAGLTVAELILLYIAHVDARYTSSEPAKIRLALRPVRQLYGATLAREFGPLALKTVRQEFVRANLVRSQINKRTRRVVQMFRWAVAEELLDPSFHQGLKAVEGLRRGRGDVRESDPVKPVPDAQVDAVRPHISRQVWAMIELQRLTGMRPGEVCAMRTCDVNTQGRIWEYRPESHKTAHHGKSRVIFLGPQAQCVLKPWLRTDLAAHLFQPLEAEEERRATQRVARKSKVQPSQRDRKKARPRKTAGNRYDTTSYRRAIEYACDRAFPHPELSKVRRADLTSEQRAELRDWRKDHRWHPHRLRHSTATRLRREFGLDVARAVLGHSSPVVTEVYAELDQAKAADVMGKIG